MLFVSGWAKRIYNENLNKTEVIRDTPKSQKSIRNIPINNKLYKILKEIAYKYENSSFFLTGNDEKFIEPSVYRYNFKRILRKSKIKTNYKFHILSYPNLYKIQTFLIKALYFNVFIN